MPLLQFHQLLLVLHVHGRHHVSFIRQHLPQILQGSSLLFDVALQPGAGGFRRHQLEAVENKSRSENRRHTDEPAAGGVGFDGVLTSAIRTFTAHLASMMLASPSMRCLRRLSLSATRTFCWRSAIWAFLSTETTRTRSLRLGDVNLTRPLEHRGLAAEATSYPPNYSSTELSFEVNKHPLRKQRRRLQPGFCTQTQNRKLLQSWKEWRRPQRGAEHFLITEEQSGAHAAFVCFPLTLR